MDDLSPAVTFSVLAVMIIIGLLPKVPIWAKLIIQVGVGLGIYFGMSESMFNIAQDAKISTLFGGQGGIPGGPAFNPLSMGFISGILGVISSVIGFVLWKLIGARGNKAE
jgi:hypothetical protein